MATTLVIKQGDFSTNKLTTVELDTQIPCTGIALNNSTLSVEYGSSSSLTATVSPADCTDPIVWTSSDSTVATVANGTITPAGVGTATITATCGSYSATCAVTVVAHLTGTKIPGIYVGGTDSSSGGNGIADVSLDNPRHGSILSDTGTLRLYRKINDEYYYPNILPGNTGRIKITITDANIELYNVCFYSSTTPPSASGYSDCAQLVKRMPMSDVTPTAGVFEMSIPSYEGYPTIDAVAFSIRIPTGQAVTEQTFNGVTCEFLPSTAA